MAAVNFRREIDIIIGELARWDMIFSDRVRLMVRRLQNERDFYRSENEKLVAENG